MSRKTYLDFDLQIDGKNHEFYARVINSPAGAATHTFTFPFAQSELENMILRLGYSRSGMRRLESNRMEMIKSLGGQMFQSVFDGEIAVCFSSARTIAMQTGHGLRIRLRLSGAPNLLNFPWEYLYDQTDNHFFTLSIDTPIVRYLELPLSAKLQKIKSPLRLLVLISNPDNTSILDVKREWDNLNQAVLRLVEANLVKIVRITPPTLASLLKVLRTQEFHIFHYIGHGTFDENTNDGLLLFENEEQHTEIVSGQILGRVLRDHRSLRLAILNSCDGGRTSITDPYAGVVQSLLQQGLPAAIAMQFQISDKAAITFSQELYRAILDGYPLDAALAEARKAILATINDYEWGTPVLYLRVPDSDIFAVGSMPNLLSQATNFNSWKKLDTSKLEDQLPVNPSINSNVSDTDKIEANLGRHYLSVIIVVVTVLVIIFFLLRLYSE